MKTWDIFCRVIDNYGDIGVCWRLARQLANEHGFNVRLWVDDMTTLMRIWPNANPGHQPFTEQVEICHWSPTLDTFLDCADVVIEAFACELPDTYVAAMARRKATGHAPHWFNLEYLSAEAWIDDCHGLLSIHPQTGLKKAFFFPGFTARSGGLVREQDLLPTRDLFWSSPAAITQWLGTIGVERAPGSLLISLFAYENPAIGSLFNTWQTSPQPIVCVVPEGKILTSINTLLNRCLTGGDKVTLGQLTLIVIPFLNQQEYDLLLWASDINFVRGEDSFVRAQWAGKPFVWHIYPQDESLHLTKLGAFLDQYTKAMDAPCASLVRQLWLSWNQEQDCAEAWSHVAAQYPNWRQHHQYWVNHLKSLGDLASNLVQFCQKTL